MNVLVIAALVAFVPGIAVFLWQLAFVKRAQRVAATVVAIKMGGDDGDVPAPIVEFTHPSGQRQRLESFWFSTAYNGTKVGDSMHVLVKGSRVRFYTGSELWLAPLIVTSACLVVAIMIYALRTR